MTDTDSLIFSVNCKNFFDKYKKLPLFDFSNFPKDNAMYSEKIEKNFCILKTKIRRILLKNLLVFEVNSMQ